MNYKNLYNEQLNRHYCTARELQYSNIYNYHLSLEELNGFYDFIDNNGDQISDLFEKLPLKSFNSKHIYFSKCREFDIQMHTFFDLLKADLEENENYLAIRNMPEVLKSRIYSEVEGTLDIENVPTTRRRFEELVYKDDKPKNANDRIIKNMANAIEFVLKRPSFTKENLRYLYDLLSNDSLEYEDRLKDGELYRDDKVFVDGYEGCPSNKIEECMDSLFDFVNGNLAKNNGIRFLLPHIAHYYILYIHPYFDYNGRTARMVSLWIYFLINNDSYPPFISDAINQTKGNYYSALSESRNAHNDITYFLLYIFDVSILYFLTYKNIEHIDALLKEKSIVISNTDKDYIKRILVSAKGPFVYTDFTSWNRIQISKQGAFKILNRFTEYGILKEVETTSNKKLFDINKEMIAYEKK